MVAATIYPTIQSDISNLSDATISIVEQALALTLKKQVLSHQQYKQLLSSIGWSLPDSKVYLKIADTFSSFSPDELQEIEPHTIFDLAKHAKKYRHVIENLKDCGQITQEKVREFIAAHRTPKKPKPSHETIWKTGRDGKPICRIPDIIEDDMQTGEIIQKEMDENGTIAQTLIRDAVALWQDVKSGKLVVHPNSEEFYEETSENFESEYSEELDLNASINSFSDSPEIFVEEEAEYSPSIVIDTSEIDVSNHQLNLEQVADLLTQVNSWAEVISITNNYEPPIKSQIWDLLNTETKNRFQQWKKEYLSNLDLVLQVNDKVMWEKCPCHLDSWQPFVITSIQDDKAMLDIFNRPVPLDELTKYSSSNIDSRD